MLTSKPFIKCLPVLLLATFGISLTPAGQLLAHLEHAYYLKGKAGTKDIAVKMLSYDETPSVRYIRYFFLNDKRDRYMAGKLINGYWWFAASEQDGGSYPKPEGTLKIAENNNAVWKGTWAENGGKIWEITLTPIVADVTPSPFSHLPLVKDMDPYERYRLATLRFVKTGAEKRWNGLINSNYVEKESGITFFRLEAGHNRINTGNINAALEDLHLLLVQKYFAYSPQKNYARPETRLLYLTNKLVSFQTVSTNRFANLITTSQIQLTTTLDMSTGETLKPEDILWLDKTSSRPAAGDFFTLYQYRKKVFAPAIFRWLQELYPEKMKTERCSINKAESWNLPAWNLTEKGLALGINSTDDCGTFQWAVIPYEKLKPFLSKKYF